VGFVLAPAVISSFLKTNEVHVLRYVT